MGIRSFLTNWLYPPATSEEIAAIFNSSLIVLREVGIDINPGISEEEVFNSWKDSFRYRKDDPIITLLFTLGNEASRKPLVYYSDSCLRLDCEMVDGEGSYVWLLDNLKRISKGELNFQNIQAYCNLDEEETGWISFDFEGVYYRWEFKIDNDWLDGYIFDKIEDLCIKHHKIGRLTFCGEGQGFMTSYMTKEMFKQFNSKVEGKLEWLKADGHIY